MMRTNLHIHFHCSRCGELLECPLDGEVSAKPRLGLSSRVKDSPELETGAAVRQTRIFVTPCRACIEAEVGPARRLAAAISEMKVAGASE